MKAMPLIRQARDEPLSVGSKKPVLETDNLTVSYRPYGLPAVEALRKVNIKIAPGEILGLVGESGAGKTTWPKPLWESLQNRAWLNPDDSSSMELTCFNCLKKS